MSYKYRFIVAFVSLELFFISLIVGVNFLTIDKNSEHYVDEKIESTQTLISELIEAPMSVYDLATLDNIVHNIKKIQDIEYIIIVDKLNRVLSTNVEQSKLQEYNNITSTLRKNIDDKVFVFDYMDIYNDDVLLGHVHLVFDITYMLNIIQENRQKTYLIIAFQIFISTILAYMIGHRLTQKLMTLSQIASDIAKEKNVEFPYIHFNDEVGHLSVSMKQMQDEITRRNEQLNLFAKVFENTQESIIITDANGHISNVNRAFCRTTGYHEQEIIGKLPNILKSDKYLPSFYEQMWKDIIANGVWHGEIINKKRDGSLYVSLLNISVIYNEQREITHFVGIGTDITEMKEKEKLMQLQSKMATMGEMLSNIAHQWRQPLSTITSAASSVLVQHEIGVLDDKGLTESLHGVIKSSQYLSKTIDDFRNYFKQEKKITTFHIKELIEKDLTIVEAMLKNNHIEFHVEIEEDVEISTYQNELVQVLMNVIQNSKDVLLTKTDERLLFIKASKDKEGLNLLVRDNGGGIKSSVMEHIFEPYFTTKHQSQGTGIGLYMSHNMVVDHMKGHIEVENVVFEHNGKEHQGLDFYIHLPLSIDGA